MLTNKKFIIYGVDNFDPYYSVKLKKKRVTELNKYKNFYFKQIDICNQKKLELIFKNNKFKKIFHFAAQAGVRYSLINPRSYINNNVNGFFNILECCRLNSIKKSITLLLVQYMEI